MISAFEAANDIACETVYGISVVSEHGGDVVTSSGIHVRTERFSDGEYDSLLVAACYRPRTASRSVKEFIVRQVGTARRVGSSCLGAFTLASSGVLDGRRATTHWRRAGELRKTYPAILVEDERVYVRDGNVWSSGGISTGVDMALGMIERDYGEQKAEAIAGALMVSDRRDPGESQKSVLLELDPKSDRVKVALAYARVNIGEDLQTAKLAAVAGVSARQFMRLFLDETGQSPAKAVELLRIEAAKFMLEQSRVPVADVAERTGFGDRERMRRAFVRATGSSPQEIRLKAGVLASF
jgi:transcriptional regulator GlxA family with amidase domain